jgi:hypothetical protein
VKNCPFLPTERAASASLSFVNISKSVNRSSKVLLHVVELTRYSLSLKELRAFDFAAVFGP